MMRRAIRVLAFVVLMGWASIVSAAPFAPYVPGEVIVKYNNSVPEPVSLSAIQSHGGVSAERIGHLSAHRVRLSAGMSVEDAVAQFRADPNVQYAEPNYIIHAVGTPPNDPYYPLQWNLPMVNAQSAWEVQPNATGIVVAVLDTGVQASHPDLKADMWSNINGKHGYNFVSRNSSTGDNNGHGTFVAGVIGAVGNNAIGVVGIANSVQIMSVKVLDGSGSGNIATAALGIQYAVDNGARVLNASYSYPAGCYVVAPSQAEREAIEYAGEHGVLFVSAAGNYGCNNDETPAYPASHDLDNVISAGATNQADALAWFSNYGHNTVHLGAPGVSIYSTYFKGRYRYMDGTSFSSPITVGALALIEANHPEYDYKQAREALLLGVDPVLTDITVSGGRLNAYNSLILNAADYNPLPPSNMSEHVSGDGSTLTVNWVRNSTTATSYAAGMQDPDTLGWITQDLGVVNTATFSLANVPAVGSALNVEAKAESGVGDSDWMTASYTVEPYAPGPLTATAVSSSKIRLTWAANPYNAGVSDLVNYFEFSTDGVTFKYLGAADGSSTSINAKNLRSNKMYYFRMAAYSLTYGVSDFSNIASAKTLK